MRAVVAAVTAFALGSRWRVFASTLVVTFLLGSLWALATPISGGPDESGHVMKAAASARGQWVGEDTGKPGLERFLLPADVADVGGEITCFAFDSNRTAACAPSLDDKPDTLTWVESGAGSYNPVYYVAVGWPTLFLHGEVAVFAMRALTALITAFFLACVAFAISLLPVANRWFPLAAFSVAATPMVFFLGGIVNPNGAEVSGTAAFVALLWVALSTGVPLRAHRETVVLAAIALVVVANLRATSPLYLAIAGALVAFAHGWGPLKSFFSRRWTTVVVVIALVGAVGGVVWTLTIGANAGFIPSSGIERDGRLVAFLHTLDSTPAYLQQAIAVFGWLDTRMPDYIYLLWALLMGGIAFVSLGFSRSVRTVVATAAACVVYVALPAVIQAPTVATVGYIWQGRYSLPLLVMALLIAGLGLTASGRDDFGTRGRRFLVFIVSTAVVVQVVSFLLALKRYVAGQDSSLEQLFAEGTWSPPVAWGLLVVAFALVFVVFGALLVALARRRYPSEAVLAGETSGPDAAEPRYAGGVERSARGARNTQ
ncbi:DUF2142 domain-containing protein [Compostimonas suwonensis]|uniref:Putative membrane protein DUF2142 n=1 Tax=Compostimonas suwonensis TaxID=1048394 RepID=A0A2M9BUV0_9MICO|nr:DUF2142 domain-containing protein [Compostimonas suwonensis]PJJ61734.1 putative membrane protein DUF2142 [Compostimonas suwonensis]